jgi:hypothetical protein
MSADTISTEKAPPAGPRTYQSAWQWNPDGTAKLMTAEEWLEEEAAVGDALEDGEPTDGGPSREGAMRAIAQEIATLRRERTQWAEAYTALVAKAT